MFCRFPTWLACFFLTVASLVAGPLTSITVVYPNGGESFAGGGTRYIEWTTNNNATDNVKIELLKNGVLDSVVAESVPAVDGYYYPWNLPVVSSTALTYTIRITGVNATSVTDTSDANFTIARPVLTLTYPNGGESIQKGATKNITWSTNLTDGGDGSIKIELLKNGVLDSTIAASVYAANLSYSWAVPTTLTEAADYTIRLTHLTQGTVTDSSDANFTIAPAAPLCVTTPNLGTYHYDQKDSITFEWTTTISPAGNVKIELYKDGSPYYTVTSSTGNDGSHGWAIPSDFQSGTYRVRITSTTDANKYDEGDNDFVIGASYDAAVFISATANASPASITLNWSPDPGATNYTIKRKTPTAGTSNWTTLATVAAGTTTYTDSTAAVGTLYEYGVFCTGVPGESYVYAGINIPLVDNRGKILLIVDSTQATPLATELARLQRDLIGDGWTVIRHDVAPTDTPASVKALIQSAYNADPSNVRTVFLFGHIPVPYSGLIAPDGHTEHNGAWPADVYYGDMDGSWTDTTVNSTTATDARNDNIPGDGKFDNNTVSTVEIAVGRVDFYNLPIFAPNTETDLLRRYLEKDHKWRHKQVTAQNRALADDEFTDYGAGFWRTCAALLPDGSVYNKEFMTNVAVDSYLFAYAAGGGDQTSAVSAVDNTFYVNSAPQAVFQAMFGSYFADFDAKNNLLRSGIAGDGLGLTNVWSGRPHWYFHPLGMGETTGYSHRLSQNNSGNYATGSYPQYVHMALMGDPALRLHIIAPPSNLTLSGTTLSWTASPDASLGYHVYRASSPSGPYTRLTSNPIAQTTYIDAGGGASYTYMVRAIALTTSKTGTYQNASQGIFTNSGQVATRISLSPLYPRIFAGSTQAFTATVLDANGDPLTVQPTITWSSTSGSIASNGTYTAPASIGTCTVTATVGGVSTSTTATIVPAQGAGTGVSREYWSGISGDTVADLTANAAYPNSPTSTSTLTSLCETPIGGLGTNFGHRLQGFFVPPVSGTYYFYINSNAHSELWLSTDDSTLNITKIASVTGYTYRQQWDKYASQKSSAVTLTAGQPVYMRVLHKAGSYGYYQVGVGVEYPGGIMERPIPAHRFLVMDNTAPTWASGYPKADTVTGSGFTLRARTTENGKAYYVVLADGATAPTPAEVKAGTGSGGVAALRNGNLTLTANTEASVALSGLTAETNYDVYIVAEDKVPNLQNSVSKHDVFVTTSVGLTLDSPTKSSVFIPSGHGILLETTSSGGISTVNASWTKISGPGTVTFSPSDQFDTAATFSVDGTYVVRLTATDGTTTATKDVTVQVGGTADAVPTNRLGWWKFDETSGTVATNSGTAGTANNVTLQSGTGITWATGKFGNAVTNDGVSYFRCSNTASTLTPSATSACTITLWVKATFSTAGWRGLFYDRSNSTQKGLHTYNGNIRPGQWDADSTATSNLTIPDNTWTFVALTISPTQMKAWMRTASASNFSTWTNSTTTFTARTVVRPGIGGDQWGANVPGSIDDVRFYDRTLSESELSEIYSGANVGPNVDAGSPVTTTVGASFNLNGTCTDDARPSTPGTTTLTWSKVSGPGTVTFTNPASASTAASADQLGTYVLRLTADDGEVKTFDTVSLTIGTALEVWRHSNFGTIAETGNAADIADPDLDGLPNLVEYALGLNPVVTNTPGSRPTIGTSTATGNARATITFNRQARSDLTYRVEASSTLATWTEIWQSTGGANTAGPVTVTDTQDLPTGPRFLRLRVTSP